MKLSDPSIKIVTVHSSGTIRTLINAELRNRGYLDVNGAPDLQTVIGILETGIIHWLITPIIMDDKINVFQVLKLITENATMIEMRISFITDSGSDLLRIAKAFDMGLLSCHSKMQSKTEIEAEFKLLFDRNAAYEGDLSQVSADYLRSLLKDSKRFMELLQFEKALFRMYAGNLKLLLDLAEAHLHNNQAEQAQSLFSQALLVNPELQPAIEALLVRFPDANRNLPNALSVGTLDVLSLKNCLLVEPDAGILDQLKNLLKQLGVKDIYAFQNPIQASQWLKNKIVPELILFEWCMNEMPGPTFVQKLRELLGFGLPISVMNRDITARDMPILHEMGVTDRIRKPIETQAFFEDVIWVINQDRAPSEPLVLMQKIRQAMSENNFEKMAAYTKRYMDSDKPSTAKKTLLQAEIAYYRGHFPSARNLALNVLRAGLASIEVMNLLGKTLMKMRDFESALCCLGNAEMMSPSNVQRICNMAEAHLEMGQREDFEEKLSEAKHIAPDSQAILEVETKAALLDGDGDKAKNLMQSLESLLSIVSFTNNRAISLIRTDKYNEGIQLYKEAIQAVPAQKTEVLSILLYNLGLALARLNRLIEAERELGQAANLKNEKMRSKITGLNSRVKKAIASGEKIEIKAVLNSSSPEHLSLDSQKDLEELMMALKINAGDLCCHKIYFENQVDSDLQASIQRVLRFKKRSSIQRSDPKAS